MNNDKKLSDAIKFFISGRLEKAELNLTTIVSDDSENADALSTLALIKIYKGEYDDALNLLASAVRIKPNIARLHFLISFVLAKLHRTDEANEFFLSGMELDSNDEKIPRFQAAILIERGQFDTALDILSEYILDHPEETWDAWNDLGMLYYASEQFELAKQSFIKSAQSASLLGLSIPFVHFNLGLCFNVQGDYENARKQFSTAIALDPELAPAWSALGLLLAKDGEFERAFEFIEKSIELQPQEPSHWFAMGEAYELYGDGQASNHYFTEGYKLFKSLYPDNKVPEGTGGQG